MDYKVCILAAGKGTRVSYAANFHKALLPVGEQSTLGRIIEKFPKNTEIVIAVGYNSHLIKEFVKIAYADRKITLVDIDTYEGEGSGPGYSLYACREHLQCPFIFTSADTIVEESPPAPSRNWLGVARAEDSLQYCMADVQRGLVRSFHTKIPVSELLKRSVNLEAALNNAFIGMAGVFNYEDFWKGFEGGTQLIQGELQVMSGLEQLVSHSLHPVSFTWYDTGNDAGYLKTHRKFGQGRLVPKAEEFIFFENGHVIKFFSDKKIVAERIHRARLLKDFVPELSYAGEWFYAYRFIDGVLLSTVTDPGVFMKFLELCKEKLWQCVDLDEQEKKKFSEATKDFYFRKTNDRISAFYQVSGIQDRVDSINGREVPAISTLLDAIDWNWLTSGVPVNFHGDLQPENVIVGDTEITLIDWRHNFGGLAVGDIYYDFAKLYHALCVSQEVIRQEAYEVGIAEGEIRLQFNIKSNLLTFRDLFEKFLADEGYDVQKVKVLSALVYLNIAPLHHYPYNIFLYYFGKYMLDETLNSR